MVELFSTSHSPDSSAWTLRQLLCCLPELAAPPQLTYDKVFRVLIVQFLDPYNFDVRSVKKSCIHIVHPDGRIIPFDTYNLFYRDTAIRADARHGRASPDVGHNRRNGVTRLANLVKERHEHRFRVGTVKRFADCPAPWTGHGTSSAGGRHTRARCGQTC